MNENIINNNEIFINNKIKILENANRLLKLNNTKTNKIIFVYSQPKVGSTSLVSSIRIFASHMYNVIHIHDEEMLRVLTNITGITVNELILYNKYIGKEVYVIDVYRSPIERKMSAFFEKIDTLHFNNSCENIQQYNMKKLINRFNKIFPFIGSGDHFLDVYPIKKPSTFDYENKYLFIEENNIKYIKLRLSDSSQWGTILTKLLECPIKIIKDYETETKPVKDLYIKFKELYKIPENYLNELENCKYLNYYYSPDEKSEYLSKWMQKKDGYFIPFQYEEYKLYEYISIENQYTDVIQINHYIDEGCICNKCSAKRLIIATKLLNGIDTHERIYHNEVIKETVENKINKIKKINQYLQITNKYKNNKIKISDMNTIVNCKY
jgi:hypothetical protein